MTNDIKYPKCPPEVIYGHCDACKTGRHKKCDKCGSTDKVEYRPEFENKCLCYSCRQEEANLLSKSRSW